VIIHITSGFKQWLEGPPDAAAARRTEHVSTLFVGFGDFAAYVESCSVPYSLASSRHVCVAVGTSGCVAKINIP
jgi:hypothetical protein